jgi:hypothetical protein
VVFESVTPKRPLTVVHVSANPVEGEPARIMQLFGAKADVRSYWFYFRDHFSERTKVFSSSGQLVRIKDEPTLPPFQAALAQADIVHIHDFVPRVFAFMIKEYAPATCKLVYQVYSPLRHDPLFIAMKDALGLPVDAYAVTASHQARHYPEALLLPMLPERHAVSSPMWDPAKPLRLWVPTTSRKPVETTQRWLLNLYSPETHEQLHDLEAQGKIQCVFPERRSPLAERAFLQSTCHAMLDDLGTGGLSRHALEGLLQGQLVFTGADAFTTLAVRQSWGIPASVPVPWVTISNQGLAQSLKDYLEHPQKLDAQRQATQSFANAHLTVDQAGQPFLQLYHRLTN